MKKSDEEKPQLTNEELEKLMGIKNKISSKVTPPLQKQKSNEKSLLKKNHIQKTENNDQDGHIKVTTISDKLKEQNNKLKEQNKNLKEQHKILKEHNNTVLYGTVTQIQKSTEIVLKIIEDSEKSSLLKDTQNADKNKGAI